MICVALANIKTKKLYKQIGLKSFKEYIREKRINLNYATAFEYTKIGIIYQQLKKYLDRINFGEENGLKKLLFLEQALKNNQADQVYDNLIKFSFRNFKKFAEGITQNISNNTTASLIEKSARADFRSEKLLMKSDKISADDEGIYLEPKGTEIVWFNYDLNSNPRYGKLKKTLIRATRDFFNNENINL